MSLLNVPVEHLLCFWPHETLPPVPPARAQEHLGRVEFSRRSYESKHIQLCKSMQRSAVQPLKGGVPAHAVTWVDAEDVLPSEVSLSEQDGHNGMLPPAETRDTQSHRQGPVRRGRGGSECLLGTVSVLSGHGRC